MNQVSQELKQLISKATKKKTIGCFLETIGCLYQLNKNQNLKEIRKERITQTVLYWFTLKPRATSSPQKSLSIPLCNQNHITHKPPKE